MSARARQQRRRARLRAGRQVVQIEVDQALLEDALVLTGFLLAAKVDDPRAVATAAARAFETWGVQQAVDALLAERVTP